jgi:ribosomal protein S18 acetylase RimI-like enzyme
MAHGFLALAQPTQMPMECSLPSGFACRALTDADLASRVSAHVDAFPSETMLVSDYASLMDCNGYERTLDLVVVDRMGAVAAFCTAWLDRANNAGLFEPVGTRRCYRRAGLARAAMSEGIRRLAALGASSVVVRVSDQNAAALACYRSLGFTVASDRFGFEKPLKG